MTDQLDDAMDQAMDQYSVDVTGDGADVVPDEAASTDSASQERTHSI